MKKVLAIGFVALASVAMAAVEEKFGAGVTLTESTAIADVVKDPEAFAGKTIRIDGTVTAVCENMGCWMAVAESGAKDAATVRVKVDDGVIVFPVTAKGKAVSAQGTFERTAPDATTYHLKATGAIVR
jgi:hypothetical protein